MLQYVLPDLLEVVTLAHQSEIHFQQDGAPAHNAHVVTAFLESKFPGKWIATHGPVNWPPRSPDLSVLDFFLWGYLRDKIYVRQYHNMGELRNAVNRAFNQLQA